MAPSFAKYTRVAMIYISCRMKLTLLIIAVCAFDTNARATKKTLKDVVSYPETKSKFPKTVTKPAIIAIEIVDPNENSTKSGKAKKRTIESALGYGYNGLHNGYPKPPRYEVYKYSQHDIPPYHGPPIILPHHNHHNKGDFQITKSVEYNLGTRTEYIPAQNLNKYYQPGTTLFSTIDQNGHVGGLTQNAPNNAGSPLPVVVLRVHPSQLTQPGALHANIPQESPYSYLNGVDLQKLLINYAQNNDNAGYNYEPKQNDGLLTHENYPDEKHTKVYFNKGIKQKAQPQKFKISVPPNTFSQVIIQDHSYQVPPPPPPTQPQQPIVYNYNHQGRYFKQPRYQNQYNYNQVPQENYYNQYHNYLPQQYSQEYPQIQNHPQQQNGYQSYHHVHQQYGYQQQQEQEEQYQQQQNQYQQPPPQQESSGHYQQTETQQVQPGHYQHPQQDSQGHYQQPQQVPQDHYQESQQVPQGPYQQPPQVRPYHHNQQPAEIQYETENYYNQGEKPTEGYAGDIYDPTNEEVREGQEDQDYNLHQISKEAGRDLHTKLYNYHATDEPIMEQSQSKRTLSVPLVLAPHVRTEIIQREKRRE